MDHPILSALQLDEEQRRAACQDDCDLAVLAGAGCGKTTTLVARYLYLLVCGLGPEEIAAITFTERAGREMRARIRARLRDYLQTHPPDQALWLERYAALDAAPIGTIHGLCARLLRAHPAEAALDPDVAVLDESRAAALQAEAVERALVAASQAEGGPACFELLGGPRGLRDLLSGLLARRLDVAEALAAGGPDVGARWRAWRQRWLVDVLQAPAWQECLAALQAEQPLLPGDALDGYRRSALEAVAAARRLAGEGDWGGALARLAEGLQRPGNAGSKQNWRDVTRVRALVRTLYDLYDAQVAWAVVKADPALDDALAAAWPALTGLFQRATNEYAALKARQRAVDFDDLEAGALALLQGYPEVAGYYRQRIKAVLVDEFQDTNERQRRLIEALLGAPAGQSGRLFVVGDAKQSIYRFRGADVTVFRDVERRVVAGGGQATSIDKTYRAHARLLETLNPLLGQVLGSDQGPPRPYRVPFVALHPSRQEPEGGVLPPYVELHLGVAEKAEAARQAAAAALAARLERLQREEGVRWHQVACLFRASTHFGLYEEALEGMGIPYVTVAGTGFYQRPEIRDLLNALRALATPTDDLALVGLLRSPAVGLADADLYHLRCDTDRRPRSLWAALQGDLSALEPPGRARARRAAEIIRELSPQVGRQPVAAVLKRFLDLTGYLAILRLCPQMERAGRNVDKLLADAHRSQTVWVSDFLKYVQTLSDTAARESEAPPEGGEAVQLMTVHRAKGLEFPVVVIADAAHDDSPRIPNVLVHPQWGLLVRVSRSDGAQKREGVAHGLAQAEEREMQDAEERRLLYVAATRARDKLLISGHATLRGGRLGLSGWLERLRQALSGEKLAPLGPLAAGERRELVLGQGEITCTLYMAQEPAAAESAAPGGPDVAVSQQPSLPDAAIGLTRLALPYRSDEAAAATGQSQTPERVWRVVPRRKRAQAPAWLVGELVHVGLGRWHFPVDERLDPFLQAEARRGGLTDEGQIRATVQEARRLLQRFAASGFFCQLAAAERHHEVPYVHPAEPAGGRIDLLCRRADGEWWLVDFKTDRLQDEGALERKVKEYSPQVRRYGQAVADLLGQRPRLWLCFLDYRRTVLAHEVA